MPGKTQTIPRGRPLGEVVVAVSDALARAREGLTKRQLVAQIGQTSEATVHRAFVELRDRWGATLTVSRGRWKLRDRLPLPLLAPEDADVLAVSLAAAFVDPLADDDLRLRLQALLEQLDDRRQELHAGGRFPTKAISASLTLGTRIHERTLRTLLQAARRAVVRMRYTSPWTNATVDHVVEPWELRIHDGSVYLRAWCHAARGPRTFRLAQIGDDIEVLSDRRPRGILPAPDQTWVAGNPAYGIDEDRPDTAVIRIRGAVARWIAPVVWSPAQHDAWIEQGEVLERTVAYQSCREMARRVLSIIDAVESIEPESLREEVDRSIDGWRKRRRRSRPTR